MSVMSVVFFLSLRAREDARARSIVFWKIPVNRGENLTATPTVKDRQRQKQQQQAKAVVDGNKQH